MKKLIENLLFVIGLILVICSLALENWIVDLIQGKGAFIFLMVMGGYGLLNYIVYMGCYHLIAYFYNREDAN